MVDLHCHILPGIDDGPAAVEESLAMAESAIAEGITRLVATPHSNSRFKFDFDKINRSRQELQSRFEGRLQIATGCDFHLNPENLAAVRTNPALFCINQLDYLLVEFNEFSIPKSMDQSLHQLQLAGLRPIITHPERNSILRLHPERLANWVRMGCFVQVTGGAITGGFGKGPSKDALAWIGRGLVHFVASDAHNMSSRPLVLRPAYAAVRDQFGEKTAEALFVLNPLAAFEGHPLPCVPEVSPENPHRKKRFFFF
jgi:protein-tyrosine phosphatase